MTTSMDATLVSVAISAGFGALVLALFFIFAPEMSTSVIIVTAVFPAALTALVDALLLWKRAGWGTRIEEAPE